MALVTIYGEGTELAQLYPITAAEPLWKRVPTHDEHGNMLNDFMMVIPKLKSQSVQVIQQVIREIESVLNFYRKHIVFVELNLNLNILWVSLHAIAGLGLEIAAAIHHRVPQAKVVAQKTSAL